MKDIILAHKQITHIIKRMAYQVYEDNISEEELIVAGVRGEGYILAQLIADELEKISDLNIELLAIEIDKKNPIEKDIVLNPKRNAEDLHQKSVVVIDDVLNSGSTLLFSLQPFLKQPMRQIKTAVLVNRNHKKYPVKADFKGISLSTSSHENVRVSLAPEAFQVVLE
ncbi:MAG: phosphoribosyltransferase [Flavobacteriaceae bacterium]|jgi:pyrimidine operon attenuation protein/uracil phosphoribosyltransferase|nr:phosphoribosyltransferase [Flavobacteriaceae bacterium]